MSRSRILLFLPLLAAVCLAAGPSASARTQRTVTLRLTEFRIDAPDTVQQGEVVISVTNAGTTDHQFALRGHRGQQTTRILKPGETVTFPLRLIVGQYVAFCTLRGPEQTHRKLGMEKTIRVVW
jgi:hypothetical protein